jgi:hypothetical protein
LASRKKRKGGSKGYEGRRRKTRRRPGGTKTMTEEDALQLNKGRKDRNKTNE